MTTATVHHIDPLTPPRRTREERRADNARILAKHNGDNQRLDALMRSQPGPNARKFFGDLSRVNIGSRPVGDRQSHVTVHPKPLQASLPLYDQAQDGRSRIPEAIQMPLELLLRHIEHPTDVNVDVLLAACAAIREFNADNCPPHGIPRPDGDTA